MQFSVRSLLEMTCFAALLFVMAKSSSMGPVFCVLLVHVGMVLGPLSVAFWAILTAEQKGSQLDLEYKGLCATLLRLAFYCFVCVTMFWFALALGWISWMVWRAQ